MNQPNPNASLSTASGQPDMHAQGNPVDAIAKARDLEELERIRRAVTAVGEATYHWDTASDKIVWSNNVADVIQGADLERISTGKGFADLLDADNFTSRYDTVMRSGEKDDGGGVPFSIEYLLRPGTRNDDRSVWVEDCGRWFAGSHGQPAEVFGVVRQIDDRHERDQELRFLGNCDPLTGLMNRGRMSEALTETMSTASAKKGSCAFLIAVISNLAVVNDAYGFDVADEVMIAVSQRLKRVIRTGDMIGRYSGAKFGIILGNCTETEIKIAAERFLSVARDSVIETARGPVWAMLSIGGVVLPKFTDNASTAMAQAEEALAQAKRQSSDSFVAYEPSQERVSVRSLNARCAAEIISGLKNDRFALAYQPIVDATTKQPMLHEALLRMRCEDGETVAAYHLIPIAEKLGLVRLIDRAVAQLAVDTLAQNPDLWITLNVSGITATDPRWFSQLTEILSADPQIAERIIVEITETVALHELEETISFTRTLREIGCRVAIDDFGAGYSSFKNLRELEIDMVKIDGSYCENLSTNTDNQYFVKSLIELAKKFNLLTTAEWVQTEEDAELLRSWGVDYLQGNLYGEARIDVPWALEGSRMPTDGLNVAPAYDIPESSDAQIEESASCEPVVPCSPVAGEAQLRGPSLDEQSYEDTTTVEPASPEPLDTAVQFAAADDDAPEPFTANPLPLDKVIAEQAPQPEEPVVPVGAGFATEPTVEDVPFSFATATPPGGESEDAPFVASHMQPQPQAEVELAAPCSPQNPETDETQVAAEPFTVENGSPVEDDVPIDDGVSVDNTTAETDAQSEPDDLASAEELGLDQSLLQSALSQLDTTFNPKPVGKKTQQTDVASAIAETFGSQPEAAAAS